MSKASGLPIPDVSTHARTPSALASFNTSRQKSACANDLTRIRDICKRYGHPLELIQKDISTVKYKPQRLWEWVRIAKEVALS
ncbi:MAG: hypothetical protein FWE91_06265 [Defluviitaleaceae bacterium]|nr:hypothetical protein [Defluviitaleaceae bacterium]MCL2836290.1 hypothetical protein [Defluviitaleaceae bacterium]